MSSGYYAPDGEIVLVNLSEHCDVWYGTGMAP